MKRDLSTCCHLDAARPHLYTPFAHEGWTFATDGHLLAATLGEEGVEPASPAQVQLAQATRSQWMCKPATHTVDFQTIRAWALEAVMRETEELTYCDECGATVELFDTVPDHQLIGSVPFNRNFARRVLLPFRDVTGQADMVLGGPEDPLILRAADALVVLMPVKLDAAEAGDEPFNSFKPIAARATA